ncbi:hypothetical protein [Dysgonomonas sp. 511]|uniref:hypothetical protein n=1 Tax=Dysgonomonas sp. 511 TaxID=2302930 RepID=UPI0013D69DC3|nr:hypothetical protein [Dysgonomonas sp. 511]NDV79576.1 hypothetical protein [Dysgonomonas sp. 511]
MKKSFQIISLLSFLLLFSCGDSDGGDDTNPTGGITNGSGKFEYNRYTPLKDKPVNVYYAISQGDMSTMPVIFVFPGTNRDADNYIRPWMDIVKTHRCMVFSIEFPEKYYSGDEYITGNVIDNSGRFVDREKWTFSIIEPLFEYIKAETGNKSIRYSLFGHSAGSQFVHRYVLFNPNAKIDKAVAANAGWYTMPLFNVDFPYGLKNTQLSRTDVASACKVDMTVHLGESDNNPNDPSLRKTPEAMLQGEHRYARGLYFYNNSKTMATSSSFQFNWTMRKVPNVAHDQAAMAKDAVHIFFD